MTGRTRSSPLEAASEIRAERFSEAKVVFLAGSVVRGEETASSDLDLVVIDEKLPAAYRESFIHCGWPVEAFVHDPETLNYFFWEVDRPSGFASLPTMVLEGKEIPGENELSRSLKTLAQAVISLGPPKWTVADIERARYSISDVCDDIRAPRDQTELTASLTNLYGLLADFYFRFNGHWSAKSKAVPRRLAQTDPLLADRFSAAFDSAFSAHDPSHVLELAQTILQPSGGFLFETFKLEAPANWRKT